ncbi:MAG TPA: hypothetical protein VNV16_14945 [Methylibium sp.]|nr:hypothetical protein [Methylibium sp.]
MSSLRISLDGLPQLQRRFTDLEQRQLPFATVQALNAVAYEAHVAWGREALRVFDRPVPLTRKAIRWQKATRQKPEARIYVLDHVGKGTAPADYLRPQVEGGERKAKGLERGLQRAGLLVGNERAILGKSAPVDAFGNIKGGVVQQILSQVGGQFDMLANETPRSKKRNAGRGTLKSQLRGKNRRFFVVRGSGRTGFTVNKDGSSTQSALRPGVYQRIDSVFGSAVRSVFIFSRKATYKPRRFDIFGLARQEVARRLPAAFERELARAVANTKFRGGA